MEDTDLRLVEPAEGMREAYLDYIDEFIARDPGRTHVKFHDQVRDDFASYLQRCRDDAAGRNVAPDRVPQTCYWLFRGSQMVGACRLRHRLNDVLIQHGGHIGYDVRPSERCKGHATRMLGMVLDKARVLGLTRVMVTCDKVNIASARVIQKNGGVLDLESWWEENGTKILIQEYWIELSAVAGVGPSCQGQPAGCYDAVIFDLGGTLADTFDFVTMVREASVPLAVDPNALLQAAMDEQRTRDSMTGVLSSPGQIIMSMCGRIGCTPAADAIDEAAAVWLRFARGAVQPRPDVAGTLIEIRQRGLKIGVITDCAADIPTVWPASPLAELVDAILFSCREGLTKPDSRIYLRTCERLGVQPERCLYVGDGGSGELAGAQGVAMHPVLICVPHEEHIVMSRDQARQWKGPRVSCVGEVLGLLAGTT